jgi:hypothetical protein
MAYTITTQRELRRLFWLDHANIPGVTKRRICNYSGNGKMHNTDTRCAFCDWLDAMSRNGTISQELAQRATL